MQFKCMYNSLFILDTSKFNYKSISLFKIMNPHNVNLHACIYVKMPDQTVNSICAFIISTDDTYCLIKL